MIAYNPKNWFSFIFSIHRGVMMKHLFPNMFLVGLYTTLIVYIALKVIKINFETGEYILNIEIHKLIGFVLGLVLVFRTNTAYERWWEGRKLWGALVNHSRMLAIKTDALLAPADREGRKFFATGISNFAKSLVTHLREGANASHIDSSVYENQEEMKSARHLPNEIVSQIEKKFVKLKTEGKLDGNELLTVNRDLDGMMDSLGGCERIRKTPIPFSYSMYIKKFIFVYVMTLPFGLIREYHWWSIPAVMFIFYILVGIELIGEEVEDPFGTDVNDLGTEDIAASIHDNAYEILRVPLK